MINCLNKKNTKRRLLALLLSLCFFTLLFCSCKNEDTIEDGKILPKLVIGVYYLEPCVYMDDEGNYVGLDVDLAKEVCRHIGFKPEFVKIDQKDMNNYLKSGEVDCIWCSFTMTGRENDYNWSVPYMKNRLVVAVPSDSNINSFSGLEGKRLAVQSKTKADELFSSGSQIEEFPVPELKELNCFAKMESVFSALSGGYVDAIAVPELVLSNYNASSSLSLRVLEDSSYEVVIGVAFNKGKNDDIREKMDRTIVLLKNNGFFRNIFASYGLDPDKYLVNYER